MYVCIYIYIVCDNMVIFYKYIYTQLFLYENSWGSMLQFRTRCFLCPIVYSGLVELGVMSPVVRPQSGERGHRYIYSSCFCNRSSSLGNDLSHSRMLPFGAKNIGLW